jgi:hydroxypyruvate isomerase
MTLLTEPISTHAVPGFFLTGSRQAYEIIDEVGAPNLSLQYDLFHAHLMREDIRATLEKDIARVGHMQVADAPDRHEPGTGGIDFPSLFALLDRLGYRGWIGAEYHPQGRTEDGLAWVREYL